MRNAQTASQKEKLRMRKMRKPLPFSSKKRKQNQNQANMVRPPSPLSTLLSLPPSSNPPSFPPRLPSPPPNRTGAFDSNFVSESSVPPPPPSTPKHRDPETGPGRHAPPGDTPRAPFVHRVLGRFSFSWRLRGGFLEGLPLPLRPASSFSFFFLSFASLLTSPPSPLLFSPS